ncbi:MAG: chemotaxis protein CheW [Marinospirillum sp.]|uniref:chemotaxis protein CheW n=1 Tax=Marinospirillum sp. TaxID=2183934 RepID=UPI0019FFDAC8|nr:chemotaxis protein CheW [Marinospirillum sp.]MBE0505586.1 chemotaxis protein CheW [Marinospirillum sp.]
MSVDLSQFHQVFIDEAYEHLATMERLLLALDLDAPSLDDLNAIFRAAHSIKGGAGTFGFTDIAELTHALETLLDRLRKEELQLIDAMIEAFLQCCDLLGTMLDTHQNGGEVDQQRISRIRAELVRLAEDTDTPAAVMAAAVSESAASTGSWLIQLHPVRNIFAEGASLDAITEDLKALGAVEVLNLGDQGKVDWRLHAEVTKEQLNEIFSFVCQPEEVTCTLEQAAASSKDDDLGYGFFVDEKELQSSHEAADGFGFFIDESELPAQQKQHQAQQESEQGFGFFVDEKELPMAPAPAAVTEPESSAKPAETSAPVGKTSAAPSKAAPAETSIRVGVEKVDQLINLVGELVITRSMLAQSVSALDPMEYEAIHDGLANLERNSRDLQEAVMSIRMLPINFVFGRFPRVVRDLSGKMHKKVALKLVGEDTELDKGLIEKLADPLTHLVRNSIDHGIETPEQRLAAGKSEQGTITLSASHQGGSILVEVVDDGAGLSRDKLIAKAQEKNIPLSDNPTDKEVWQLIFAAGFSTAKEVTDVSGRGVGMDVVMRNITEMKGQIEIDSVQGQGTRIGLRLPLTLAILDGMSLRIGDEVFILPLTRIIESMQPETSQLKTVSGKGRVVHIRGEYLPLLPLYKVFGLEPRIKRPEEGILVVVESAEGKLALFVDELIAQNQVVIKSLEAHYRKVPGVSGATIMGDGRVALIIDIEQIAKMNTVEEQQFISGGNTHE